MIIKFETKSGLVGDVQDPVYSFSCGPYKMSLFLDLTASEATQYARQLGKKCRLSVDGLVTWWGFISEVSCDLFSSSVTDIKNHLLSVDNPTLTDSQSIADHGPLSASYDDDGTDITILARPVLRTSLDPSRFGNKKMKVRINCEGPLLRLNRVIYRNDESIKSSSGGQLTIGLNEVDQIVTQLVNIPFDVNFVSIKYTTEGSPTGATFQILDTSLTPISTVVTSGASDYESMYFSTIAAGTDFYIRFSYFGPDKYNVALGPNTLLDNCTSNTTGAIDYPMSIILRLNTSLSVISSSVNSYISNIGNPESIMQVFANGGSSFIDSGYNKLGDYLTNLALLRDLSLVTEVNQWEFYLWILENEMRRGGTASKEFNYIVPMVERSDCTAVSGSDQYQGFIVSNWYGTISYTHKTQRIKYS